MRFGFSSHLPYTAAAVFALCWFVTAAPAQPATAEKVVDTAQQWPIDAVDWRTSPVDLSFLNASERPAGKRGFVRARGDALQFADGTEARFWGTNVTAAALFGTDGEAVPEQARRLSQLGFNLVRLHHHDSYWVAPNIFGHAGATHTRALDPEMLRRLDWWIHCLKAEGIYVWLDLHVQRQLRAADEVPDFAEIAKGKHGAEIKGYNYVNPGIREAMQQFNESYLGHVNVYSGLAYKDDPAIAAVLITNENDVTHHFGGLLLPDKDVPGHHARYMAQAKAFAVAHDLPADKVWRSWENGPSKLFLNELEHRFNVEMVAHLRRIGVKVPIATTNLWGGRLLSLPSLADGDLIDVHAYERTGVLERDPRQSPTVVHTIAAAQLAGRPLSVTEWNMGGFPAPDRHVLPLYVAATAVHQGWDALMQYAYAQTPLQRPGHPSNWHAFNDPAMLAMLPAAALLFRQQHVRKAQHTYVFSPSKKQMFDEGLGAGSLAAVRTAAEIGRVVTVLPKAKELPWLRSAEIPAQATPLEGLGGPLIPAGADEIVSATGELRRNWSDGTFTIDSPATQAAMGRLNGKTTALQDIEVAVSGLASVAVQSLDGKAIARSRSILISIGTGSVPSAEAQLPFRTRQPTGMLTIRAPAGLKLRVLGDGDPVVPRPRVTYRDDRYTIHLDSPVPLRWLQLHAFAGDRKPA